MSTPGLPEAVAAGVREALAGSGGAVPEIRKAAAVGGGCIHHTLKLETTEGPFFVKWNRGPAGAAFRAEARGLEALRRTAEPAGLLDVPRVLGARDAEGEGAGWLLLEYLPPSPTPPGYDEALGRGLAHLHGAGVGDHGSEGYGWPEDNRIGSLPQENPRRRDWATFWRDARLSPHFAAAFREGALEPGDRPWVDALLDRVEAALAPVAHHRPQLVHGDLWSGNVHPGPRGRPVLVDPAAYYGRGEVDLAMAQLFGGFGAGVFRAYGPLEPGWEDVRRPLYQLFYLLVHLRLFGRSYYRGTRSAAEQVVGEVG